MSNRSLIHIRFLALVLFLGLTFACAMGQETQASPSRLSSKVIKGDADNDGLINMMDVTVVINYILGRSPENFSLSGADTNSDGYVNMIDVTNIINIILRGGSTESGDPSLPTEDPEGGDPGTGL